MIPEIELSRYSYSLAKIQSEEVDRHLGFEFQKTESQINKKLEHQNWKDLPIQSLMTPYTEIRLILNLLQLPPESSILDLGSAYGRMAYVIAEYFPHLKFIGYELEDLRTQEAHRVLKSYLSPRIQLQTQDLSHPDFKLPVADAYFIYDFGLPASMSKSLNELKEIAKKQSFKVIARGRGIRHLIHQDYPWLSEVNSALHSPEFSIYTWQI